MAAAAAGLVAIAAGIAWLRFGEGIALRDAASPTYLVRRWRGEDLYDARERILYRGNRSLPEIALTFDDGPRAPVTELLLDKLRALHVQATFFVVGCRVVQRPDIVQRMFAEGHEVGNHSQNHERLDTIPAEKVRSEINDCDVSVTYATGRHLRLMRPPGVRYNPVVLQTMRDLGYTLVNWTVGAHDYEDVTSGYIGAKVVSGAGNGSIVLLHSDRPATLAALPHIVNALREQGYRFVTISEMMRHLPPRQTAQAPQSPTARRSP